jgi:hypothetical protein
VLTLALAEQRVVTLTAKLLRLFGVFRAAYWFARVVAAVMSGSSWAPASAAASADACTWRLAYHAKPTSITIAAVPRRAISATTISANACPRSLRLRCRMALLTARSRTYLRIEHRLPRSIS